jgi:hypothetical protein
VAFAAQKTAFADFVQERLGARRYHMAHLLLFLGRIDMIEMQVAGRKIVTAAEGTTEPQFCLGDQPPVKSATPLAD